MFIQYINDQTKKYYGKPSMVLTMSGPSTSKQNHSDNDICQIFSAFYKDDRVEAIVISCGDMDPMDRQDELRSFIFSARKFFPPDHRPIIAVYTSYYEDELDAKGWSGIKCELLHYGNILLKLGRPLPNDTKLYFNKPLGIPLLGKYQSVYKYNKMQHM